MISNSLTILLSVMIELVNLFCHGFDCRLLDSAYPSPSISTPIDSAIDLMLVWPFFYIFVGLSSDKLILSPISSAISSPIESDFGDMVIVIFLV